MPSVQATDLDTVLTDTGTANTVVTTAVRFSVL